MEDLSLEGEWQSVYRHIRDAVSKLLCATLYRNNRGEHVGIISTADRTHGPLRAVVSVASSSLDAP